ncbi:MAG: 30S ribosomal protein S20 [Sedimentisphaerales bacterium]|nr:30S ribosomal protein S20 [Sedimentisphaerales bacterium]
MAHSLSAKKRARQNIKRRAINRVRKSQVKTQIRHFEEAVQNADTEAAEREFHLTVSKLDKTASTSTMHKKTAARRKSRLAKKLNALKSKKDS